MCGIAGFFGSPPAPDFVHRALCALAARGPDGSGVWQNEDGTVALVHTRLAILDLTEAGSQPMEYQRTGNRSQETEVRGQGTGERGQEPDEVSVFPQNSSFKIQNSKSSSILVFNGEIYNYRELRRELEAQGETFASDGDTEVLLRLLVREGAACLPRLAGMFAFAFWDEAGGTALLARDPLGIKPLYYRTAGGALAFASETRVLQQKDDALDPAALRDYFLWGSVPDPQTVHQAIRQLPAGHLLKWDQGRVSTERWHLRCQSHDPIVSSRPGVLWRGLSPFALITRVALEESMHRHLVSDVPVGIFLSGGIDSTVLLALARNLLGAEADIRTFSIGFDDPAFDESGLARRTSEHFGTVHTEWRMTQDEGLAEIPAFMEAVDQPGIDGFNTWCVSKLASREGMKVVLSGLGGDELFAGYSSFVRVPQFRSLYRGLGPLLRPVAARMLDFHPAGSPLRRLAAFLRGGGEWLAAYHTQRGIFTPTEAEALAGHLAGEAAAADWTLADLPDEPRDAVSRLEITRYMGYQLLRDSDVYSMAQGLELRVPFVDVRLIRSLSEIPPAIRLRQGKQLLLEAVPEIPDWIRNQRKAGFRFPFQRWMESGCGEIMEEAKRESPVELKEWYRTWAVAAALKSLPGRA
jgi:asparagine synthase (glutamine-hydrolysing)